LRIVISSPVLLPFDAGPARPGAFSLAGMTSQLASLSSHVAFIFALHKNMLEVIPITP
jgi:hypothetical protein